jgi:diacylglycerol kinase family enzyme
MTMQQDDVGATDSREDATPVSIVCILNLSAGAQSKATRERIAEAFVAQGTPALIWVAESGAELAALANRAIEEGHGIIVAGGGDGTLNCIAGKVLEAGRILGILPMGTLNHFAKDLGVPLDLGEAVAAIAHGRVQQVDVGEVNGRVFLNNSSLGLYPRLVREREKLQGIGNRKWVAFVRALGFVLRRHKRLRVQLETPGAGRLTRKTAFVFLGNNEYRTAGWQIGTRSRIDAGHLWIYMVPHRGISGLILLALRAILGRLDAGSVEAMAITQCTIRTGRRLVDVATDGEVNSMPLPLHYRIRPRALRVLVPAATEPAPSAEDLAAAVASLP